MRPLLLILIFSVTLSGYAQPNFWENQAIDCNGQSITISVAWDAYQTLDNTRDGVRDSSICIAMFHDDNTVGIRSSDIDINRPVFMRYVGEDIILQENWIYMLGLASFNYDSIIDFDNTDFCNDGFCGGSLIDIRIPNHPDSTEVFDHRISASEFGHFPETVYDVYCSYTHCVPTEYFQEGNVLQDVVLKFVFREDFVGLFDLQDLMFAPIDYFEQLEYMLEYQSQFELATYFWGGMSTIFALRPDSTYPDHYEYIDFYPSPNVDTVATVSITFTEDHFVLFQPYVDLRGGTIEGGEERHSIELINNGATFCMNSNFIEVKFHEHDRYVHKAGNIDFRSSGACMMFNPLSTLEVSEAVQLTYGTNGQGVLALAPSATIELDEGAGFELDARLVLIDGEDPGAPSVVDIVLPPFTTFTFTERAEIKDYTSEGSARLRFILQGGSLELGEGLSAAELAKIDVIYDLEGVQESIELLGNPVEQTLRFRTTKSEEGSVARVIDSRGRLIDEWMLTSGTEFHRRDLPTEVKGAMTLEILDGRTARTAIFVRQ